MTAKTQTQQIGDHLRSGASLTAMEALDLFGCFRTAARIDELRHSGMNIVTTMVDVVGAHGKARVAQYSLAVRP